MFVHVIPCTALVILNLLLFRTLKLARQNRKRLFSRCSGPMSNKAESSRPTVPKMNTSKKENLIFKTNKQDEFEDSPSKQNLRSKLSNAFTTIILSNNSLAAKPNSKTNSRKNSKGVDEVSSSLPLTEDTVPTAYTLSNNNSAYNLNNSMNLNKPNNQTSLGNNQLSPSTTTANQLLAHQIATTAVKTSSNSNSSIHSCTISNQISPPTSIYQMQTSSLNTNGQFVNATVICTTNSKITSTLNSAINTSFNTFNNASAVNTPNKLSSISNSYITTNSTANLINSNDDLNNNRRFSANGNINLNEHNLVDNNQNNLDNNLPSNQCNTLVNKSLIDNKNETSRFTNNSRSNSTCNQLNLPPNQFVNLNSNKSQNENFSSASHSSTTTTVQKPSKKPNKLSSLECRRQRDNQCTTLMLIVIVSVFLSTEIPLAITTLLHVTQNILDIIIVDYKTLNSTILFTNFFIMLSYPVNFAIYCGMSRQFRETFKVLILNRVLCRGKSNNTNGRFTTTNATYSNFECSRNQFRHNSVTNQLITLPSAVIQLKNKLTNQTNNNLLNQQASDNSTTSNQNNNNQEDEESINLSKQDDDSTNSKDKKDVNLSSTNKESKKEKQIRFKTNSFELENCDLNNNDSTVINELDRKEIYLNQLEPTEQNAYEKLNKERPAYIETNL